MKLIDYTPELIARIKETSTFYVIPHIEPDGDCLGSALALGHFLERIGKTAHLHNLGPFDRRDIKNLSIHFDRRIPPSERDPRAVAIVLDCSTIDRIGDLAEDISGLKVIVIDHHSSGREFGNFRHINPSAPSTSLLVQQLIETMGYTVDEYEAYWILFAFGTDTGFFRHLDKGTGEAFRMVSRLVERGASPKDLYTTLNSGASLVGRKHLGMLLNRTESYAEGKILVTFEKSSETEAIGKQNRESDMLYQLLMGIEGVEVVVSLREESPRVCNGGLRSRSKVDVGKIALSIGGGGHTRAAGFQVNMTIDETKAMLLPKIVADL